MIRKLSTRGTNILLASLSPTDRHIIMQRGERVALNRLQCLVSPGVPIEHVYFPEGGIISITTEAPQHGATEVGIFGRDGLSGLPLLMGDDQAQTSTYVQVDGTEAVRVATPLFLDALQESATLHRSLLRFVHAFLSQVSQTLVANARYPIEVRLARWQLMSHDRLESDQLAITHEFIAMMIAAQRSGVTLALHVLEGIGVIKSTRGLITIRDRARLEALAGDSYGIAEVEYRRLVGPFGGPLNVGR